LKPLHITGPAETEIREAVAWYRERDPRVAEKFAAEVRQTLQLIEAFPQIGGRVPAVPDGSVRRLPVHAFPYSIVFVALADIIEVVAVAHNRRRPDYFITRIEK
jgi:plasmid stabilization system protein ParE